MELPVSNAAAAAAAAGTIVSASREAGGHKSRLYRSDAHFALLGLHHRIHRIGDDDDDDDGGNRL